MSSFIFSVRRESRLGRTDNPSDLASTDLASTDLASKEHLGKGKERQMREKAAEAGRE